jgi:AmiR/NasT family two-component response regulator
VGLATWSVKEIAMLRTELKAVTTRLAGRKLVERAKGVLQSDQGMSEERAYEYLRRLSRQRRITLTALAEEVIRNRAGREQAELSAV